MRIARGEHVARINLPGWPVSRVGPNMGRTVGPLALRVKARPIVVLSIFIDGETESARGNL